MFRNLLLLIAFSSAFASFAFPSVANVYITQNGNSQGVCTASLHDPTWFNNAGNWGTAANQIGPGTVVHLCGTFTGSPGSTILNFQGSGTSGNVIELLLENGAALTAPYWSANGAINVGGAKFILIDGGVNGSIQATANGTGLAFQLPTSGIVASGGNVEIRNVTIANLYVHNSLSDTAVDQTQVNCIRFSGSNVSIHDNTMHDAGWCLYEPYGNGDSNVSIYNNTIFHSDHGWALATSHAGGSSGPFSFYSNHVYGYSNWDTTANVYHHDGIHCYTSQTGGVASHISTLDIYNNLFEGPVGASMTAHIFIEGGAASGSTPCEDNTSTVRTYNNVFLADQYVNNGLLGIYGAGQTYNNTIIGKDNAGGVCAGLNPNSTFENNVVENCNQLVYCPSCSSVIFDYNAYGTANNAFVCKGSYYSSAQFSNWQACVGGDAHSFVSSNLQLNPDGSPQAGSPVVGAGTNLYSLGITPLDSDTSNGNLRTPIARPTVGGWNIAAFQISAQPVLNPPNGLTAAVQ